MIEPLQTIDIRDARRWRAWLEKHHASTPGIWLVFHKDHTGVPSIPYEDAVRQALCFGWIDGQRNGHDDVSFLQKFTPRRARSIWSKRNCDNVERLIAAGKMTEAGHSEIERAKADGRWEVAYDSPANMQIPADFLKELKKNKEALAFFETLNKTNKFAIAFRMHTAKRPETRERRKQKFLEMMAKGEKLF